MESAIERREQIAECLRLRRQDTVSNLAAEFNVCNRTIRYDLTVLSMSYPIVTQQGKGGGIAWVGKRPVSVYTEREIGAIKNAIRLVAPEDAAILEKLIAVYSASEPFDVSDIFTILAGEITQIQLASKLGIGKSTLSNIMAGRRRPSAIVSKKILKIKEEVLVMNED